jgi:hypothetical protein
MSARITYDKSNREYRNVAGKVITHDKLTAARDAIVKDTERKLIALTEQYKAGKISLVDWQIGFKDVIKPAHTLSAGIAMGGKDAMTVRDWGKVGGQLRVQYQKLFEFALQVEQGKKINMGRVKQYARAVGSTFKNAIRLRFPEGTLARWVRSKTESCTDCLHQESRGVLPAEDFPQCGSLRCGHNCGCGVQPVAA